MGGSLVIKFVKPIKLFCSWTPYKRGIRYVSPSETKADVGATAARILGKPDTAVRQESRRLNLPNRILDEQAEFLALLFANGCPKVLNFHEALANEDHLGDFGNPGDPGIAHHLGIESQHSSRFLRIAARGGLPLQQALFPIQPSYRIDISDKFIPADATRKLDLHVLPRLWNFYAIFLAEAGEQHNCLLEHTIPVVTI
jgi:hypothetical protein